jgi:hypothetical protein
VTFELHQFPTLERFRKMNINLVQVDDNEVNALRPVTGHDFSRAANARKEMSGFSPCVFFTGKRFRTPARFAQNFPCKSHNKSGSRKDLILPATAPLFTKRRPTPPNPLNFQS